MADGPFDPEAGDLIPRDPTLEGLVDLMASASGIAYEEAAKSVVVFEIDGVPILFFSPELLYRMKKRTGREKDSDDIYFLEQLFAAQGRQPPEV